MQCCFPPRSEFAARTFLPFRTGQPLTCFCCAQIGRSNPNAVLQSLDMIPQSILLLSLFLVLIHLLIL